VTPPPKEEDRTERVGIRLSSTALESWKALAKREGITLTEMIERAVEYFGARDQADELAEIGRRVVEIVNELAPRGRKR
jgi:hypothetical protein